MDILFTDELKRRVMEGISQTPAIPCKHCGRETRAWWSSQICQHCAGSLPCREAVALLIEKGLVDRHIRGQTKDS